MELQLPAFPLSLQHRDRASQAIKDYLARSRSAHTRSAYLYAWRNFLSWVKDKGLQLEAILPMHIGAWLEDRREKSKPQTQRQHLSAVRALFDVLLEQNIVLVNPAARIKAPRFTQSSSHTDIFAPAEAQLFFESLDGNSLKDQRNRALMRVLLHLCPRISAVLDLTVKDYYLRSGGRWLVFREKRGKEQHLPVHPKALEALDLWLTNSGLLELDKKSGLPLNPNAPIFSAFERDRDTLTMQPMGRRSVYKLIRRLTTKVGIAKKLGCHSFRATGITFFRLNGGSLEDAGGIAGHKRLTTTQLYDRSFDEQVIEHIKRVDIPKGKQANGQGDASCEAA